MEYFKQSSVSSLIRINTFEASFLQKWPLAYTQRVTDSVKVFRPFDTICENKRKPRKCSDLDQLWNWLCNSIKKCFLCVLKTFFPLFVHHLQPCFLILEEETFEYFRSGAKNFFYLNMTELQIAQLKKYWQIKA